jgi:hypothetical protein
MTAETASHFVDALSRSPVHPVNIKADSKAMILIRLIPVNELAMDFPSGCVDNGYLKVLVVTQAVVAEMLRKLSGVRDGFKIAFEVDPDPISKRDAIFHIKKELLHCRTSNRFSYGISSKRRDYRKRLAESPRLGANDRNRSLQCNGDACGGRPVIDQRNQARGLGRCPSSAANARHKAQSGAPAFVPKRIGYGRSEPCGV